MTSEVDDAEAAAIRQRFEQAIFAGSGHLRTALEHDPASFLHLLAVAHIGARQAERLLHDAVTGARRAGHSWEAIGTVLGVTRQAAQQRFRATEAASPDAGRRVLTGVHLFNELGILEKEGRRGFHLVDFGALYLIVEPSKHQWKHRRLLATTPARTRRLEADGWIAVGTWFPFQYFKRPLDAAPTDS